MAEAVLVEDGMIVAVGSNEELLAQSEDAYLTDLDGATVLPGFIDSHSHFSSSYVFPQIDRSNHPLLHHNKYIRLPAPVYFYPNPAGQ